MITEKGQTRTERIHMHGIVWTNENKDDIIGKWNYGIADIGKKGVNEDSAGYLVKYMSKVDEMHKEFKSKVFTSAGIGKGYIDREDAKRHEYEKDKTIEEYRDRKGNKTDIKRKDMIQKMKYVEQAQGDIQKDGENSTKKV